MLWLKNPVSVFAVFLCRKRGRTDVCSDCCPPSHGAESGRTVASDSAQPRKTGSFTPKPRSFDYGCGRGDDLRVLSSRGIRCQGWDPVYAPDTERRRADVVNLGYVVNVIEDPQERAAALHNAWALTRQVLVVAARLSLEAPPTGQRPYRDGFLTQLGTFPEIL